MLLGQERVESGDGDLLVVVVVIEVEEVGSMDMSVLMRDVNPNRDTEFVARRVQRISLCALVFRGGACEALGGSETRSLIRVSKLSSISMDKLEAARSWYLQMSSFPGRRSVNRDPRI